MGFFDNMIDAGKSLAKNVGKGPSMKTGAYGSSDHIVRTLNKNVKNSVASNAKSGNGAVKIATEFDDKFLGGNGRKMYDTVKEGMGESNMMKGILPTEGEYKQIRREFGDNIALKKEVRDGALSQYDMTTKHLNEIKKLQEGIGGLGEEKAAEYLQAAGKFNIGDDVFDYTKSSVSEINELATSLGSKQAGWKSQLDTIKEGYYMQDQDGIEKTMSYFTNKDYGRKRQIAAGVGVGALALGGRLASGGSLTRDGEGRQDIAVVPFI